MRCRVKINKRGAINIKGTKLYNDIERHLSKIFRTIGGKDKEIAKLIKINPYEQDTEEFKIYESLRKALTKIDVDLNQLKHIATKLLKNICENYYGNIEKVGILFDGKIINIEITK